MKKFVGQFVRECRICQRYKYDTKATLGVLQPLPIPERVWSDIPLDFIDGLPKPNSPKMSYRWLLMIGSLSTPILYSSFSPFFYLDYGSVISGQYLQISWYSQQHCL